jgi:glutathione S-transferase
MLTVHHLQDSQSERIPWLCEELGIEYDLKLYKRDPIFAPASYKALTAMGTAPVITDGDLTLGESGAVVEYIIQKYGSGRLALPPSHPNYANYLYWFHFSNANLQPAVSGLFRVAISGLGVDHIAYQRAAGGVKKILGVLEQNLGQATWLAGDDFTAADVMSFWSLTGMRVFAPIDLSGYPNILAYMERVANRPAYKTAMAKGDPDRESVLGGPPPNVFAAFGRTYKIIL